MIMDRLKGSPECANVLGAMVTPLERVAPHQPNWNASFVSKGAGTTSHVAFHVALELASKFDLAI
jgi:hypothetical protein